MMRDDSIDVLRERMAATFERARAERARALVVDDSDTYRMLSARVLVDAGYEVQSAEDGEQAWSLLQQRNFDVVVADCQMPKMDGLELVRRVRASHALARLPVVLLTAMDAPRDREAGLAAGAEDYIFKGHAGAMGELLRSVERLTRRAGIAAADVSN